MNRRVFLSFLVGCWLLAPALASACNIPVFRYALERWRTDRAEDRYDIFVFHRGSLSANDQHALDGLRALGDNRQLPANCDVAAVDLDGNVDKDVRRLWTAQKQTELPWVLMQFPYSDETRTPAWAGPLNSPALAKLAISPARRELARRLMSGDSVVWLLLESGDAVQNRLAKETLDKELRRLEKDLKLPDGTEEPVKLLSSLPLHLRFSVLSLARDDPEEAVLIAQLLHANKEKKKDNNEPIVFPIFGRGRVLNGLAGKEINAEKLEADAMFLCGACSCEVKRLNPGVDLLMAVDWDAILIERTPLTVNAPVVKEERVPIARQEKVWYPRSIPPPPPEPTFLWIPRSLLFPVLILLGIAALAAANTILLRSKNIDPSNVGDFERDKL